LSVILLSIARRSRKYSHAQTKKPRRRKDTLLYMSALQMMEGLSLIEEQGVYLELTENDHAFLADLLQKAERRRART